MTELGCHFRHPLSGIHFRHSRMFLAEIYLRNGSDGYLALLMAEEAGNIMEGVTNR